MIIIILCQHTHKVEKYTIQVQKEEYLSEGTIQSRDNINREFRLNEESNTAEIYKEHNFYADEYPQDEEYEIKYLD